MVLYVYQTTFYPSNIASVDVIILFFSHELRSGVTRLTPSKKPEAAQC